MSMAQFGAIELNVCAFSSGTSSTQNNVGIIYPFKNHKTDFEGGSKKNVFNHEAKTKFDVS